MRKHSLTTSVLSVLLLVGAGTVILALRSGEVRTQGTSALAFDREFSIGNAKMSYEDTRDAAQRIMNCYFNRAIRAQMEQGTAKFRESVKQVPLDVSAPSEAETKCEEARRHPIAARLLAQLDATLAAIPKRQERIGEERQPNPKRDQIHPCNFTPLDSNDSEGRHMLAVSRDQDYFEQRRQETINPTYAAYTVTHCYKLLYFAYLEQHFANDNVTDPGIVWSTPVPSVRPAKVQTETPFGTKAQRRAEYERERNKTEQAFRFAVESLDTLSKTYPLHVRYAQMVEHSKEIRDQIRRFRVAMDQLVYKLINQSTRNP